jgi:hypothetical protein
MAASAVTHVVQRAPVLQVREDPFGGIWASGDVASGALVLLEHVLAGERAFVCTGVGSSDDLFAGLYPRSASDPLPSQVMIHPREMRDAASVEALQCAIATKVRYNAFQFPGPMVLGDVLSKFNHSCVANCCVRQLPGIGIPGAGDVQIMAVFARRPVPAGAELTLDYVNGGDWALHAKMKAQFGFACDCPPAPAGPGFAAEENAFLFPKAAVARYLSSDAAVAVVANQALCFNGIAFPTAGDKSMMHERVRSAMLGRGLRERAEAEVSVV